MYKPGPRIINEVQGRPKWTAPRPPEKVVLGRSRRVCARGICNSLVSG